MGQGAAARGHWHGALQIALFAIVLRVLLPVGVMPTADGKLVICTGAGPLTISAPLGSDGSPSQKQHDQPCGFAGPASAVPLPGLMAALPIIFVLARAPARAAVGELIPGRGLAAPPPPAHAPPTLI